MPLQAAWTAALILGLCQAPLAQAAIPAAEQLLPDDTLLVLTFPNYAAARDCLANLPASRFWRDPAMKPFRDDFMAKCKEAIGDPLERELGIKLDEYASLLRGQITLAITRNGWQGQADPAPAILFLLDAGDRSGQLKSALAKLRAKWVEAGEPVRTERIRDADFTVISRSGSIIPMALRKYVPEYEPPREVGRKPEQNAMHSDGLVVGQIDSLLVIGSSIKAVEKVAMRLGGAAMPSLADEAAFANCRLTMFRDAPFYGWANTKLLFGILARAPVQMPNPEAPSPLPAIEPTKMLAALGLTDLRSVALAARASREGTQLELSLEAPEASREGFLRILALEAMDSSPPSFIPADAMKFQRWRVDGQKTYAAFAKMICDLSPQAMNAWYFLTGSAQSAVKARDPAYDLKRDFVGNLGDDVIRYQKAPVEGEVGDSMPWILLLGSPRPERLVGGLRGPLSIWSPQAANPETRDFLGRKIYSVPLVGGLPFVGGAAAPGAKLYFAASGGYAALTTDVSMLEEYLRTDEGQARPLRDIPGLMQAVQQVGGPGGGLLACSDRNQTMRALFEKLKAEGSNATNGHGSLNPIVNSLPIAIPQKSIREWMDFSLLPDFDKVSKYFSLEFYGGSLNVESIMLRYFAPTPAQLQKSPQS